MVQRKKNVTRSGRRSTSTYARDGSVGTLVVSQLYKHVMRISHAGHREFLGYQSQAGNTSAYSNGSEIHTAPLDSSPGPRALLGLPIPGRNLLTAGGVSETPHTPFGPRGLTITKSAQR